jgi:hypothetical protein
MEIHTIGDIGGYMIKTVSELADVINEKFLNIYAGETDPSKLLDLEGIEEDPKRLSREMAKQPAQYAFWGAMKARAKNSVNKYEDRMTFIRAKYFDRANKVLTKKNKHKAPTLKEIESYIILNYSIRFCKIERRLSKAKEDYENISVIEHSLEQRSSSLKMIGSLIERMMQTGIYVYKQQKGKF